MVEPSVDAAPGIRCAVWSRTEQIDPVGSAGSYSGYLLVEWPLPWPRDAGDVEELEPVRQAIAGRGLRIQLVVPETDQFRRVAFYCKPEGPFTGFVGRELRVRLVPDGPAGSDRPVLGDTTVDGRAIGAALGRATDQLLTSGGEPIAQSDVLVCTHGRRDRCCGSLGTELWQQLGGFDLDGSGARLARTSHTGGHRFAATCLVLPAGTLWGFLDADALSRIVRREGPLDDLIPRYRGCSGLDSPAAQALERAVLAELGWPLFEHARSVEDLGGGHLRLVLSGSMGTPAWEATVVPGRTFPVPDCGQALEHSKRTEAEYRVENLARVE